MIQFYKLMISGNKNNSKKWNNLDELKQIKNIQNIKILMNVAEI